MRYIRIIVCLFMILSFVYSQGASSSASVRLLITRPNDFAYTTDPKTVWISAIAEAFLHFRLDAVKKLTVIPLEETTRLVSSHRNFTKRVSKSKYVNTAKELNATHVLYSEYEVHSSKEAIFYFVVIPLDNTQKAQKVPANINLNDINGSLNSAIRNIVPKLGISKSEIPEDLFRINILGTSAKNIKRLGNYLIGEKQDDKSNMAVIASNCEKVKNSDYSMYLAYYTSCRLYAQAGKTNDALRVLQELVDKFKNIYPKLNLQLARYYRESGNLNEAKIAINRIATNRNLRRGVLLEKGLIYEAMGNMSVAYRSFQELKSIDDKNPEVYLHLAKASIALQKGGEVDRYVKDAAKLSGKTKGKIYCEIGDEFLKTKDKKNAIAAYRKSIEIMPDNTDAWLKLGNLQYKAGMDSAAAISYLNLFKLDYIKYQGYLEKAGKLLEKKGLTDMARQVYTVSFQKHGKPKIAVLLATLEFKEGNCLITKKLLEQLAAPWDKDPEIKAMLEKCSEDKSAPVITIKGMNPLILDAGVRRYIDPGATARDEEDGDLTDKIKITGTVNTAVLDTYRIVFTVKDRSNNVATKVRTVLVTDNVAPIIELKGSAEMRLNIGGKYREPGATAIDNRDGKISSRIKILGIVNTKVPGINKLTYIVKDAAGNSALAKTRRVIVEGDKVQPVLTLIGGSPIHLTIGDRYKEPGATAIDDVDGNLTLKIVKSGVVNTDIHGMYTLTYKVTDKAGNTTVEERIVNVREAAASVDNTPPVISLIGGSPTTIYVGDSYEEPGVNAIDDVDGDVTAYIDIKGEVKPSRAGEYTIIYSVADKSGNKAKKELTVTVRKKTQREDMLASAYQKKDEATTQQAYTDQKKYSSSQPTYPYSGAGQPRKGGSKRKAVLGITTAALGVGSVVFGIIINYVLIPDRYNEYDKAGLGDEVKSKHEALRKTIVLRNLSYIAGGIFGVGFTVNLIIPSKRK